MSELKEDIEMGSMKQSSLLNLPAELRMLIWEAVANIPIGITELWNVRNPQVSIAPSTGQEFVINRHGHNNWQTNHKHENDGPDPMGWLRTNHQIYEEGKPIFDKLSSLRICKTIDLMIFLCPQWSPSILNRNTVQYLSFCYRVAIHRDPRGGFAIGRTNEQICPASPVPIWPDQSLDLSMIQRRRDLQGRMPALKEIRLQLAFLCDSRSPLVQLNSQEELNFQRRPLGQSRYPDALKFRGSEEEAKFVVYKLVLESMLGNFFMLRNFFKSSKFKVHVDIQMDRVEHDYGNDSGNLEEACWCKNRCIDPETFSVAVLTNAI